MDRTVTSNRPELWGPCLPRPATDGHKYDRGYAAILAAAELTGATRLAASACSRIGCGLVSVVAATRDDVYRSSLPPDIMVHRQPPEKMSVLLGGPGGVTTDQFNELLGASQLQARVFDAGAIPRREHFNQLDRTCVITPHIGEFERLFGKLENGAKTGARAIASESGATVVLKSSRTIIASPDGRTSVNSHTSPYLAIAGTGDVLAGIISGLVAQRMPHFEACCAAVWIHGEAGRRIGPGLIAGDIVESIPHILQDLLRTNDAQ